MVKGKGGTSRREEGRKREEEGKRGLFLTGFGKRRTQKLCDILDQPEPDV